MPSAKGPERAGDRFHFDLPGELRVEVDRIVEEWRRDDNVRRLWAGDETLWTRSGESRWTGWLEAAADAAAHEALGRAADAARSRVLAERPRDVLLIGMGGSSLCPEVLSATFGPVDGFPRLGILDSTDPATVRRVGDTLDPESTLFIVSSKSGTTLEPEVLREYMFDRAAGALGAAKAARRFMVITDPGSALEARAERDGYLAIHHGVPSIGGRYSALSAFGMIPAAMMGCDVPGLLEGARRMAGTCSPETPIRDNTAVVAGIILGVAARGGRDKVTLIPSPALRHFGAWLEQLLAESTGKNGRGLIPVDGERIAPPDRYGKDRVFVHLRHPHDDADHDAAMGHLASAGHPVLTFDIADRLELGGEFLRWECATAVAGAVLGVNPFDQPDVEASKEAARLLTREYEKTGTLPREHPIAVGSGLRLFADAANERALGSAAGKDPSVTDWIRAHLGRLAPGDCFTLLAWLDRDAATASRIDRIRHAIRDGRRVATSVGFGPRYLHSTGQIHKGGPDSGVFLLVTCGDAVDLPIPGRSASLGTIRAAQARGDFDVLAARGRRVLRCDLGTDVIEGIEALAAQVERALRS